MHLALLASLGRSGLSEHMRRLEVAVEVDCGAHEVRASSKGCGVACWGLMGARVGYRTEGRGWHAVVVTLETFCDLRCSQIAAKIDEMPVAGPAKRGW